MARTNNQTGYDPGHPWYYLRGGKVLSFKEIRQSVIKSGYQGYMMDRIQDADDKLEPRRSELLRTIRAEVIATFRSDAHRYRSCATALRQRKAKGLDAKQPHCCEDVHQNIALKHNHLFNDFAILIVLNDRLSQQMDLFDFEA
jgi:hypothetical protein